MLRLINNNACTSCTIAIVNSSMRIFGIYMYTRKETDHLIFVGVLVGGVGVVGVDDVDGWHFIWRLDIFSATHAKPETFFKNNPILQTPCNNVIYCQVVTV